MKSSTPWIIALILSVLVNGMLGGYVLHRATDGPDWRSHHRDHDGRRSRRGHDGFDMQGFVRALPPDVRETAFERLRSEMRTLRETSGSFHEDRADLHALMMAEEFDAEAVSEALAEMRERRAEIEARMEAVVLEIVSELDQETREAALEAARARRREHRPRRREAPRD